MRTITSLPLQPDGSRDTHQVEGIRYYLLKPYLLITELPVAPTSTTATTTAPNPAPAPERQPGLGAGKTDDTTKKSDGSQPQTATPTAPSSDTSFSAAMASYAVKLIYLPDYAHPMALQVKSGLFGTTSMAPTLTDGWMLASLNGSLDSGTSAALSAVAGLASGGGSASGKGGSKGGAGSDSSSADQTIQVKNDLVGNTGFAGMDAKGLSDFTDKVVRGESAAPSASEIAIAANDKNHPNAVAALMKSLVASAAKLSKNKVAWGEYVLPPGLYEFAFAPAIACPVPATLKPDTQIAYQAACSARQMLCKPNDKTCLDNVVVGGELLGLRPVTYFCSDGPQIPKSPAETKFKFSEWPGAIEYTSALPKDPCLPVHQ